MGTIPTVVVPLGDLVRARRMRALREVLDDPASPFHEQLVTIADLLTTTTDLGAGSTPDRKDPA